MKNGALADLNQDTDEILMLGMVCPPPHPEKELVAQGDIKNNSDLCTTVED
jgi:hypothetical protein